MLMKKRRLVRAFIGKYLSSVPRGKDNCLDFDFGWIEDRSSSTEFGKNLILIGARSTKTEFKAGRGVQEKH